MSVEDIARRNEEWPGYELVDYAEVALPIWQLSLDAISVAHQRISPIQEFVLKSLATGLSNEAAAGFLGLSSEHVNGALSQLSFDRLIRSKDSDSQEYAVTEEGIRVLSDGALSIPVEDHFSAMFDGIRRILVAVPPEQIIFPRDTETGSLVEIAAIPPRRPSVADLDPGEVERFLVRGGRNPQEFGRHILRLKRISRHKRLFRRAVGLVFKGLVNPKDIRLKLIVGGVRAEDMEQRFAAGGGLRDPTFLKAISNSYVQANLKSHLGQKIAGTVLDVERYRTNQQAVSIAKLKSESLDKRLHMAKSGEVSPEDAPSRSEIEKVRSELRVALEKMGAAAARPAAVYEQVEFLSLALKAATQSISISSRTLSPVVVTPEFKSALKGLLLRNVSVEIRLDKETYDRTRDVAYLQRLYGDLQRLGNLHPNLKVSFIDEKRYFHLAVDASKMLVSNRPFLSSHFRQRTFEQFSGFFIQEAGLVQTYLERFKRST